MSGPVASSTLRACAIPGRVVMIHDMPDRTVVSELDAAEADLLLAQMERALREVVRGLSAVAGSGEPSPLGAPPLPSLRLAGGGG